jgi:hypothetical protein
MSLIEDLRKRRAEAEARAKAAALTPEEQEAQAEHAATEKAEEDEHAANAARRRLAMPMMEAAAQAKLGGAFLVQAIDAVGLFPRGKAPLKYLPASGVIVIRNPTEAESNAFAAHIEAKTRVSLFARELAAACTVDPAEGPDAVKIGEFFRDFPEAAGAVAMAARELGGARAKADKRAST